MKTKKQSNIKSKILITLTALFAAQVATAASKLLPSDSLICDSAEKFEAQVDRIAAGNYSMIPGCGLTHSTITVELVDFSPLGATEVYAPSVNANIFVDGSDLK